MASPNLIIGNGQALTSKIPRTGGGGPKTYPYDIGQVRSRLTPQLDGTILAIDGLPPAAKPRNEGVALVALHPAFLSKTYMPGAVLRRAGLRILGSRGIRIRPDLDLRVGAPTGEQFSAELYVSGSADSFREFRHLLLSSNTSESAQRELRRIERIKVLRSAERLAPIEGHEGDVPIEIVLHGAGDDDFLLDALDDFARSCGASLRRGKRFAVPGLVFMPGMAARSHLETLAEFSPLRCVRRLPKLRIHRPTIRQRITVAAPDLPTTGALDTKTTVTVFDGGLGVEDFARWCKEVVPPELSSTQADYLSHGTEVTSALLFGALSAVAPKIEAPAFNVVHHRVIGSANEQDVDLYDCMHKIDAILAKGDVRFANLSLGPRVAMSDDHPHPWTSMLDRHLAKGKILASIAAGNDGELGNDLGRLQPPADAVNGLSVGSANSTTFMWRRAGYSCWGPGRTPGRVKPDGLAFGGCEAEPLVLLNPFAGGLTSVQGTSFSAPLALRVAAAARAMCDTELTATALRALLIHRAETSQHDMREVGWGRFPETVEDLLVCRDNEATVLYQGLISAGGRIRAQVPLPLLPMGVNVLVKATFCFASDVDAAHPVNYTQHGLTIVFRPRGPRSSLPFFSGGGDYESEQDQRDDGYKWETVLQRSMTFRAEELLDASFDIEHGARRSGAKVDNKKEAPLPYVLVVSVITETAQPVYERILQKYTKLRAIQLRQQVTLKVPR